MKLTTNRINLFLNRYKILPPLFAFTLGILINEYVDGLWVLVAAMGIVFGIVSVFFTKFRFLLMIPIGLLFSANPLLNEDGNIEKFIDTKVDIEGTLYRSPEDRERGSRLFLDADFVISDGEIEPARGKVIITTDYFIDGLSFGDRVRVLDVKLRGLRNFLNPGGFDLKTYYQRRGIRASGFVKGDERIISFGRDRSSNPVLHYIDRIRIRFGTYVRKNFQSPESDIYSAITVGLKGGIPRDLWTGFSRAGVAHILAISGLHVGAVAVFFYLLIKFALARSEYLLLRFQVPRLAAGITIIPVFLYTAVAGFSTSAVRAFIMISLYLASILLGKDENKINTLGAAALVILIWHPWSFFELSFRLSFAAVFGILMVHKFYPFKFRTLRDKFYSIIKSTIAAGFATLPFVVNSFGILPLISIPANIIFLPFVEFLIIPLGLISFIAFLISPHLAYPLVSLNIILIDILVFGIKKLTEIPYSFIPMPRLSAFSWILFISTGITLLLLRPFRRLKYLIPFLIIGFLISSVISVTDNTHTGGLEVNFLDTGVNKSAVFITLPGRQNILIDGGYRKFGSSGYTERAVIARYLLSRGVRNIDYLILTSSDKDHLKGVKYLLENFAVKRLWTNGDKLDGDIWELIYERGIDWRNLLKIEDRPAIVQYKLEILTPGSDFSIKDSSLPYPIALKLTGRNLSFLLGEALHLDTVQKSLLGLHGERLKSRVLYMPETIADDTLKLFLNSVSPEVLVTGMIEETGELNNSDWSGAERPMNILQTGKVGTVTIDEDAGKLVIRTFTGE